MNGYDSLCFALSAIADSNDVEKSWFLQGVVDHLFGEQCLPPEEYREVYLQGWNAGGEYNPGGE